MSCSLTISLSTPWPLLLKLKTSALPANPTFLLLLTSKFLMCLSSCSVDVLGAELTPGNSPAWLPPPGAAQIARSGSVNANVNVEGHTSIFTFFDLPHGFEREEIKSCNLDQAVGRAAFMTGLYMGCRLDTVGTEDSAQIMRSVFHMALLVLIVLFPSPNTPSLLGIFCCSLVFSLPAGLSTPGMSFPTFSPDTMCRPDRIEVFSPCHQKKQCLVQPRVGSLFSGSNLN